MLKLIKKITESSIILSYFKLLVYRKKWCLKNKHNFTTVKNCFNQSIVSVGNGTYGELNVIPFGNSNEKLVIGNYCSIAPNCTFLLGGEHEYKTLSTYPFKNKYNNGINEAKTKGPIMVEDDVWIGFNSLILSGVTIHKGAIVAAGSVVTKDIPPYAIVGGNPAKVIKFRFDKFLCEELADIDYSSLDRKFIKKNMKLLNLEITKNNISLIKDILDNSRKEQS